MKLKIHDIKENDGMHNRSNNFLKAVYRIQDPPQFSGTVEPLILVALNFGVQVH